MEPRARSLAFFAILGFSLALNGALLIGIGVNAPVGVEPEGTRRVTRPDAPVLVPRGRVVRSVATALQLDACRNKTAELEANFAALRRLIQRVSYPGELFERLPPSPTNPLLARDLQNNLEFGDAGSFAPIECRGSICKVLVNRDAGARPVLDVGWSRKHVRSRQVSRGVEYFSMHENIASGRDILQRVADKFQRSGAIERCAARFRDEGTLNTILLLTGDEMETEDKPIGLSFRVDGELVGTPLGHCLTAALQPALEATELPLVYRSASLLMRFPEER